MPPKSIKIPPNFELLNTQDHGHNLIRCTLIVEDKDKNKVQCGYITRNTANPKTHICFAGEPDISIDKEGLAKEIACLIGKADLPLNIVEEGFFIETIKKILKIGQKYHSKNVDLIMPKLNRQKIRNILIEEANKRTEKQLALKRTEEGCTVAIDSGSLSARHFIDFVITSKVTPPFLYKAIEKNFVTIEDYKNITESILLNLINNEHLKIVAIVTDNLYVQVAALAHWHPDSLLNKSENSKIRQIFFFSCLCHTTDLIVSCTEKSCVELSNLTILLKEMVTLCRIQKMHAVLGSRCPDMVVTRWLSKIDSINFILSNKEKLLYFRDHADEIDLTTSQISRYVSLFTEENFEKILTLAYIIFPFYVLIKEFENDKCRQYKAVPYYEHLEKFLRFLSDKENFKNYKNIFEELLRQLDYRKKKTLHWELLCAAYSLTYQGRIWLRKKNRGRKSNVSVTKR